MMPAIQSQRSADPQAPHVYDATLDPNSNRETFFAESKLVVQTGFFRLPDLYEHLQSHILPKLENRKELQVWSAGCSDGREPYSLAMVLDNWRRQHPDCLPSGFSIDGLDINGEQIAIARKGTYQITSGEQVKLADYQQYITCDSKIDIQVVPQLRRLVRFTRGDILSQQNDTEYDLIICTNVLFYYATDFRKEIVRHLLEALKPGGYIYLEAVGNRFMRSIGLQRVVPGSHYFAYEREH